MRNIVFMLGLMSCASLQAQGISSNNRIDLSGQWRFSQGDAPTYEDVVKLPGSMLTNGKGNDVCTHTQWTGSLYDSSFYFNPYMEKYRQEEVLANGKHRIKGTMKFPFFPFINLASISFTGILSCPVNVNCVSIFLL